AGRFRARRRRLPGQAVRARRAARSRPCCAAADRPSRHGDRSRRRRRRRAGWPGQPSGRAARADPDRVAPARLSRPPARPGAVQASAAHPDLGLRCLRPERRRGPYQRPPSQARSAWPPCPPHSPWPRLPARPAMKTGSLRARVILSTLAVLAIVLAGVVTAVTLAYRAKLDGDLHTRLAEAGASVLPAGSAGQAKRVLPGLALEGIAIRITPPPPPATPPRISAKSPTIRARGSLLILDEVLPDGTKVSFSTSRTSINRSEEHTSELQSLAYLVCR